MKKKNGFIAISLIYSFFLVFLITLLAILADYAHNRILLSNAKNAVKEKLNTLSEFNPMFLPTKEEGEPSYSKGDIVNYVNETWQVLSSDSDNNTIVLMLDRNLNEEEISNALNDIDAIYAEDKTKIQMCLDKDLDYGSVVCNKEISYTWQFSLAKKVVDDWFNKNALLQKAKKIKALDEMEFQHGTSSNGTENVSYNSYVRIPSLSEITEMDDTWAYDVNGNEDGEHFFSYKAIRPVITVKKKIT